ncbi:hypothetical protein T492DRAFT_883176 [Pavlovales sp. CCMP2436]|nr:hypothetical protein T492DRAFT_883176 [Pavlovales sp. CCMP2436]
MAPSRSDRGLRSRGRLATPRGWLLARGWLIACAALHTVRGLGSESTAPSEPAPRPLAVLDPIGDPWARDDAFLRLSEAQLAASWSADDASLASKLEALAAVEHQSFVDVRLVCFDGDGREGVQLADAELSRHLDAMSVGERVPLTAYTPARTLHVSRRLLFHVSHTRPQLCARVTEALRKAQGEGSVAVVTVDVVLAADHAASAEAYTLYVLNPALLTLGEEERLYAYTEDQNAEHGCEFPAWVSRERYAWLDLSAGPISMGPSISGSGRATERARSELAMEIAATVASGAAHLLAPPLERLPPW